MKEIDTITDAQVEQLDSGQLRLLITTSRGHKLAYTCDTHAEIEATIDQLVTNSYKFNN